MKRYLQATATTVLMLAALAFSGSALALKPGCDAPPCGGGGGNKPPVGETASNNLSYPVIWSDGMMKPDFVQSTAEPVFATVLHDEGGYYTELVAGTKVYCVGEEDIVPPETVPSNVLCYYGRLNLGLSETTGLPEFSGDPKVWWLQQRQPHNAWQAFNVLVDPALGYPLVVTGVDTGDLLESSIVISAKQIRTEFTLLKHAAVGDALYDYVLEPYSAVRTGAHFQAFGMSGAVPGTDQSIAETQGTDYAATLAMADPTAIRAARNYFDPTIPVIAAEEPGDPRIVAIEPPLGMHATVYSACARLMIQKVVGDAGTLYWGSAEGSWMPRSAVNVPVVDIHAWDGSYSAEVNSGGGVIYGYNWNTKNFSEGAGIYRLTFLLEGSAADGGKCPYTLNTFFDTTSLSVNVGERRPATIVAGTNAAFTHGEGGLVYVDVEIAGGGGGGGGGRR